MRKGYALRGKKRTTMNNPLHNKTLYTRNVYPFTVRIVEIVWITEGIVIRCVPLWPVTGIIEFVLGSSCLSVKDLLLWFEI